MAQCDAFFDILYSHAVFSEAEKATEAQRCCFAVCATPGTLRYRMLVLSEEDCQHLDSRAFREGLRLLRLRPKLHAVAELGLQLTSETRGGYLLSPSVG